MTNDEEIKEIKYDSVMDRIKKDAEKIVGDHLAGCMLTTPSYRICTCGKDMEKKKIVDAMYIWYRTGYRHGEEDSFRMDGK